MSEARKTVGVQTKAKTMAAALDVFCEQGYSGASMSKIAKSASVLPGSIYWMFDSKEDLFAEVLKDASEVWRDTLTANSAFPPTTVEEFGEMYRSVAERQEKTPRFIRLIFVVAAEASARTDRTLAVVRDVRKFWRDRAEQAIVENIIGEDTLASRKIARDIASLGLHLADGVYVAAQVESDEDSIRRLMPVIAEVLERELRHRIEQLKST